MDKPLLFASNKVTCEVVKMKKPHTIAETLIKHYALEMIKAILSEEAARKLQRIPLSDNVISAVKSMILVLIFLIKLCQISKLLPPRSQLDKTKDQPLQPTCGFRRYVKWNVIEKHFLFCKPLKTITTTWNILIW